MDSIIFDVDGTLWDSTEPIAKSWSKAIQDHTNIKVEITKETMIPLLGKPLIEIAKAIFPGEPEERLQELLNICCEQEHIELLRECAPLYEGLQSTLEQLSKKYRLFIVSNCQAGYIEVFLKTSGLGAYFSGHLCPGDTGNGKGANIKQIIETYQLHSPVYVGDTNGDKEASKEAGIPFVYAAYGLGQVEESDYRIERFPELLELF